MEYNEFGSIWMEHFAQRKPLISVLSNKECLLDK